MLATIGSDVPLIKVYNKIDKTSDEAGLFFVQKDVPERVNLSAQTGVGVEHLTEAITLALAGRATVFHLTVPHHRGALVGALHDLGVIDDNAAAFNARGEPLFAITIAPDKLAKLLGEYDLSPIDALPSDEAAKIMPKKEGFELARQGRE